MKDSNEVFNQKVKDLETLLNSDNKKDITENEIKIVLYNLLRECLVRRQYGLQIGHYSIDLTPQNLGVIYEDDETYLEVSNDDLYQESERFTEARYFVIDNNKDRQEFDASITKAILSEGTVLNNNGEYQETYHLELITQFETDEIINYIKPDCGIVKEESPTSVYITREINRDDHRTDVVDLLAGDNIIPVTYYERENIFIPNKDYYKIYNPNNYHELIPDNSDKMRLAKMIYSCVIEYYTEFIKDHN